MSELVRFPAPIKGMNFSLSKFGLPPEFAQCIINGVCRDGGVIVRSGTPSVSGTSSVELGNSEPKKWLHTFIDGSLKQTIGVTTGADVYKLTPSASSVYSGSGSVTESNAVMFDGVLQYTLYPAAAPRTWDGYSDAALSFTRPATGDWSDPVEKVTNGDFASGASWTTGAGWAIGAGTANATASSAGLTQSITFSPGRSYTVVFTLSGFAAGTVTPRFTGGTTVTGTARSASGTYTETITAHSGGNTTLEFLGAGFTGSIDNVSVKIQGNLTDADVTGFCVHKSRVWYWSRKSDEACYTALQARGGTLSRFPLGYVAETGGNIVLIETLTMDGGNGPDDFLAFILDTGECLIYQGSDPASANDWSIVGRFRVPPPLNGKCVTRLGGDSLFLTASGLIPLQNYIKAAFGEVNVDWIDRINPFIKSLKPTGGALYFAPNNGLLLVSVENASNTARLLVMDTKTGGWSFWVISAALSNSATSGSFDASNPNYGAEKWFDFSEIDGSLRILANATTSNSPFFVDALRLYGAGSSRSAVILTGVQIQSIGQKSQTARIYFDVKDANSGVFTVSSCTGGKSFVYEQFTGSVSSSVDGFESYGINYSGKTSQFSISFSADGSSIEEGALKFVSMDIVSDGVNFA